jgi:hypothetical protein
LVEIPFATEKIDGTIPAKDGRELVLVAFADIQDGFFAGYFIQGEVVIGACNLFIILKIQGYEPTFLFFRNIKLLEYISQF